VRTEFRPSRPNKLNRQKVNKDWRLDARPVRLVHTAPPWTFPIRHRVALGHLKNCPILNSHPIAASVTIRAHRWEQSAQLPAGPRSVLGAIEPEAVLLSYSEHMDHIGVLREKIGRLRMEIADIQELNQQFRCDDRSGAGDQIGRGQERLQAIQHERLQLADFGRTAVSTEQTKEKHGSGQHPIKQKRAA
jgi:hypothetical protein